MKSISAFYHSALQSSRGTKAVPIYQEVITACDIQLSKLLNHPVYDFFGRKGKITNIIYESKQEAECTSVDIIWDDGTAQNNNFCEYLHSVFIVE